MGCLALTCLAREALPVAKLPPAYEEITDVLRGHDKVMRTIAVRPLMCLKTLRRECFQCSVPEDGGSTDLRNAGILYGVITQTISNHHREMLDNT
jgi:hypothetical protein